MQIFIKLTNKGPTITLDVQSTDSIARIIELLCEKRNYNPNDICLTFNGKILKPLLNLTDYKIRKQYTLELRMKKMISNKWICIIIILLCLMFWFVYYFANSSN